MKYLKSTMIVAIFLNLPLTANAQSLASFELECIDCLYGENNGNWTATWETPFDAAEVAGFVENVPGFFFQIPLPSPLDGRFFAHSEDYPGGYNFFDFATGNYAAMRWASTIFRGPTSAPIWRCGEYEDTVNYFEFGADYGTARLTISGANDDDCDGVVNTLDLCPGTAIPEAVPTVVLKPNHWALTDDDDPSNFNTVSEGKGKGPNRSYTIEDTAGCSCEQIIESQGLGNGHTKHGCSISAMDDWVDSVNMP